MARQTYALMGRDGCIYTLRPVNDPLCKPFKWIGYCDGDRCGMFKTKADFEAMVDRVPAVVGSNSPHAQAAFRAEAWSTLEGKQILARLVETRGNTKPRRTQ